MEDYKAQVQSLQAQLSEMQERAITAEDLSSQWQNKSFNLQLAITDLENQLKYRWYCSGRIKIKISPINIYVDGVYLLVISVKNVIMHVIEKRDKI